MCGKKFFLVGIHGLITIGRNPPYLLGHKSKFGALLRGRERRDGLSTKGVCCALF